jgi:hypothetical protein
VFGIKKLSRLPGPSWPFAEPFKNATSDPSSFFLPPASILSFVPYTNADSIYGDKLGHDTDLTGNITSLIGLLTHDISGDTSAFFTHSGLSCCLSG